MDHRTFLSTLPPDVANRLTEKKNTAGIYHFSAHLTLVLIAGILIANRVPFWPLLLPFHGILLTFLFTLEHEATHKTPFASEALNEWTGSFVGLIIFLPFQWFRYFHLAHHRYTNVPEKDPELLVGAKPVGWASYVKHVSGLPYWADMITQIAKNALGRADADYLPRAALPHIKTEARLALVTYALALSSLTMNPLLFWVWLLPLLLGQPFLRLFLLAEHGRCAFVADMFENTRTTYTTRVVRFLAWNMPYHVEHHVMPNVPFHNLPRLHGYMQAHLKVTENGYVEFNRQYVGQFTKLQTGPTPPS